MKNGKCEMMLQKIRVYKEVVDNYYTQMSHHSNLIQEIFESPNDTFIRHLQIPNNTRILFSGRFGIGKTTFINYFFYNNKKLYNVIHLHPVNYSIMENEDIFNYIKYDILVTLFKNHEYPSNPDYYTFLKSWPEFLVNNLSQLIATLMLLIPKMGKQLNQFIEEIIELRTEFSKYINKEADIEMNEIKKFLTHFHEAEGGIYESNVITLIIQEWLKGIKQKGVENILVIDDLDRIDPSQIFRLLNVFSAHWDFRDTEINNNKFGFDKIILVCDLENIKSIYKEIYGIKTDFNGYVDKFYSKEIYRFDNKESVISMLQNLVGGYKIELYIEKPREPINQIRFFVTALLYSLILNNLINLRSIFKFHNEIISLRNVKYKIQGEETQANSSLLLSTIYILSILIGDLILFKEKIDKLSELVIPEELRPDLFIGEILYILNFNNHKGFRRPSSLINYEIRLSAEASYSGQYQLLPLERGNTYLVSLLMSLNHNNVVLFPSTTNKSRINILDLFRLLLSKI